MVAIPLIFAAGVLAQAITPQEIVGITEDPSLLKGRVTVVVFISARCPVSNAYGDRLESIYKDYSAKGVRFLFVNANVDETAQEMAQNAKEHGFTFPIYQDSLSRAAIRLNAQSTPEVFVIGKDGKILYHGAVDDAQNPARVHRQSLRLALDAILAGQPVAVPETKAFGCTIKRPRRTT